MDTKKPPCSPNSNAPFKKFIRDLHRFTERPVQTDNSDVKKHIASFKDMYDKCDNKSSVNELLSQACGLITKLYVKLAEYVYANERNYIQEFYCHWKQILCHADPTSRSKYCERSLPEMHTSLTHLRSAENRMEQIAIIDVLSLYCEYANLQDIDYDQIAINGLREIAYIARKKSPKATHNFLNYLNVDGDKIFTIKPSIASAVNFQLDALYQLQEVWLDFNLKDSSIAFVVYSSTSEDLLCSGTAINPEIRHLLLDGNYMLLCKGFNLTHPVGFRTPDTPKIVFACRMADKVKVNSFKSSFNIAVGVKIVSFHSLII
ncbi:uncharacterized protein LOC119083196 isoform X2 [Bradysia coprophila]|uniref:uncharacterized protein LOC119083196 isoform X2 n=1 Tax=Bradysia coprophila TaxID=38358 RepID=UPI00187DCEAD|nr:uncharacterized protein LOC119083196 isoform X2 [Bradysia coprophila]